MTRLFDGVAGLLSGVFGDTAQWLDGGRLPALPVQSIFRSEPIEVEGGDGEPVLITQPTWRVSLAALPRPPERHDRIIVGTGETYVIVATYETRSPAQDRFVICVLERVAT